MIKATPKLKTKRLWAGLVRSHVEKYDEITFFSRKPKAVTGSWEFQISYDATAYYCPAKNKEIVLGGMILSDFKYVFDCDLSAYLGADGRPKDTRIIEIFRIELTTIFDAEGIPIDFILGS